MEITYGDFNFTASGIPTPRINYNFTFDTTSAGRNIGSNIQIELIGQMRCTGVHHGIMQASGLRAAFEKDYESLIVECDGNNLFADISADLNNGIHTNSINFNNSTDDRWGQIIDFSISMSSPVRLKDGEKYIGVTDLYVSSLEDSWSMTEETGDADYLVDGNSRYYPSGGPLSSKYYTIARTTSAVGKKQNDRTALENARRGVNSVLNNAPKFFGGVLGTEGGLVIYDRAVSYEASSTDGRFTFIENFKAFSGSPSKAYTHNFTISNSLDSQLKRTVTINGTIKGFHLESQSNRTQESSQINNFPGEFAHKREYDNRAYINASGGLSAEVTAQQLYARVRDAITFPSGRNGGYITRHDATQSYPDFKLHQDNLSHNPKTDRIKWINPIALSFTTDHNINEGTISYSCAFDNRPLNLIPGAITETLAVSDKYPTTGYASQNIMYRGAMMQNLGTTTTPSRTVSYNATFPDFVTGDEIGTSTVLGIEKYDNQQVNNIFKQFDPGEMHTTTYSWIVDDQVNANFIDGSFSKTRTWNYTINNQGP